MRRKRSEWKIRSRSLMLGERTLIMGVLNLAPDSSSSGGGKYQEPDRAYARAMEIEEEGADLIDISAESTNPRSGRVPEAEEIRRLIPVLKRLRGRLATPVAVATYKSGVAERALELGAEIINDPSGLTIDPLLPRVAVQYDAGLVLNHMRGAPETWAKLPPLRNVMGAIAQDLESCVHRASRAGVQRPRMVIDPGLGFGKRKEQNAEILARLPDLLFLDLPILVGPSHKLFLKQATDRETEFSSAAAVTAAILGGAHVIRVHDVKAMRAAAQVADAVLAGGEDG